MIFAKLTSAIAAHGHDIHLPPESGQVDYEAELGVVITRQAYRVSPEDALEHVGGYFTLNDVSARDFQGRTTQWVQGKSFPTFAPTGPFLVTLTSSATRRPAGSDCCSTVRRCRSRRLPT